LKKYDVILADPPWNFKTWSDRGKGRSAENHYPVMSINDIQELPVRKLCAENCALFLWVTWTHLRYAFDIMQAWGFIYRTDAWVWSKKNKSGTRFMGMGYYTRANTEICLLAVKGKMPVSRHDVLAFIDSPIRKHSQKPEVQYLKIEALYPDMKYLELFARKKRDGWDSWGNEVKNDIELEE